MIPKKTGDKGKKTEELIRTYFLRAGFFVLRGVKLKIEESYLTDVDLWVYERSATLARRRTIIDIKDKVKPQAAERFFFVKGLAEVIGVEGAGVVTTDNRPSLREMARRNKLLWIDGNDLQRMKNSAELGADGRLSEEELESLAAQVDIERGTKQFSLCLERVKSVVGDRFGPASANVALEELQAAARTAVTAHPNSDAACIAGRLTYLAAAIAAASLDFASADSALRPLNERHHHMTEALRFGDDAEGTLEKLKWTEAAIRQYVPNGGGMALIVRERFTAELQNIPAENLAEVVTRLSRTDALFNVARTLERAAYYEKLPTFDELDLDAKSFAGAVLDFVEVDRVAFAKAWKPE